MKRTMNYDFLNVAKQMPPLSHNQKGQHFNIDESDVANWLVSQPSIKQKIFDMANNKKVIVFNPETGEWQGCDYED